MQELKDFLGIMRDFGWQLVLLVIVGVALYKNHLWIRDTLVSTLVETRAVITENTEVMREFLHHEKR